VFQTACLVFSIEYRHYRNGKVLQNLHNSDLLKTKIAYNTPIFTAMARNHGNGQKSRYTAKITVIKAIVNSWFSYSPNDEADAHAPCWHTILVLMKQWPWYHLNHMLISCILLETNNHAKPDNLLINDTWLQQDYDEGLCNLWWVQTILQKGGEQTTSTKPPLEDRANKPAATTRKSKPVKKDNEVHLHIQMHRFYSVYRSSSDGVVICYVLPVFWIMSCFLIIVTMVHHTVTAISLWTPRRSSVWVLL